MIIRNEKEHMILREGGRRLALILRSLVDEAKPGISMRALDGSAEAHISRMGGIPIFKGYRIKGVRHPYPASICTSINNEVVHAIPRGDKVLQEGDILSIDIGMKWGGLITDTAVTVGIGKIAPEAHRLILATRKALRKGIDAAHTGAHIGDIGHAIQNHLESNNLGVIRELAGHSTGRCLHEEPLVPNFGTPGAGRKLEEGMVLAIEPMATLGTDAVKLARDGWTFTTADGSLAAHFEHTIALTPAGAEILTQ